MVKKVLPPSCECQVPLESVSRRPTYLPHMDTASCEEEMKVIFRDRYKINKDQISIVLMSFIHYRNGIKNDECPKYNSVYRFSKETKLAVFCFFRPKHTCKYALWVRNVTLTDQLREQKAAMMFHRLTDVLGRQADSITRGCASNHSKTCSCQGSDPETCGATFNYGCAWSERMQGCKYRRSKNANKFHLTDKGECNKTANEKEIADICNTAVNLTSQKLALGWPETYKSQIELGKDAPSCRLGSDPRKCPYSSFTCNIDFSCHVHLDVNNVLDDVTGVYTLTREGCSPFGGGERRNAWRPKDEQFHVLASYRPYFANEHDLHQKLAEGQINVVDMHALKGKAAENSGGIAIALPHNSLSFECARYDHHATTFLRNPNRKDPKRISLVFYLAKRLTKPNHGYKKKVENIAADLHTKHKKAVSDHHSDAQPLQVVTNMDLPACKKIKYNDEDVRTS